MSSRRRFRMFVVREPAQPPRAPSAAPRTRRARSAMRSVMCSSGRLSWHAVRCAAFVFTLAILSAHDAAAQNLHYGMNTRVLTPRMADKMVELGAGVVRLPYGWDLIEPTCKGCFEWTVTDAWRDEAKRTGRAIFGSLTYAPRWANGGHPYNYPPLVYQDYYDFVYAVVSRYKDDIFLWGVWNE